MKFFTPIVMLMLLAACEGGVRDTLGINRDAPDEFVVVSRPPLSVPPEFELTPPTPGAISPQESTRTQARNVLTGGDERPATAVDAVSVSSTQSSGDAVFFGKLKINEADPHIRQKLGADITKKPDTSKAKSLLEKLNTTAADQPVVDAKKEAARLRKNKKAGKPITTGKTPTVETKDKGILDAIF